LSNKKPIPFELQFSKEIGRKK